MINDILISVCSTLSYSVSISTSVSNPNLFKAHYPPPKRIITYQALSLALYPTLSPSPLLFKTQTNLHPISEGRLYSVFISTFCLNLLTSLKEQWHVTYQPLFASIHVQNQLNSYDWQGVLKWRQSMCLHILSTESLQCHQLLKYYCISTTNPESAALKMTNTCLL